ncbi:hypothetical protein FB45DRAFT_186747 [Roridomyces roridus]|uniref:Uncharacterized protein n=1 Tax=Roridomyces roridus TaxID=1738132 RepID=A0AAD7CEP0_9AGAR|nr:hypothetical protein FB45DRAFT_186747 [Roridomyces roridus]
MADRPPHTPPRATQIHDSDPTPRPSESANQAVSSLPHNGSARVPVKPRPLPSLSIRTQARVAPADPDQFFLPKSVPHTPRLRFPIEPSPITRSSRSLAIQNALPEPDSGDLTLLDLMTIVPPSIPRIYKRGTLSSTRNVPAKENLRKMVPMEQELARIVPAHSMMKPLLDAARTRLANVTVNTSNTKQRDWAVALHPLTTSHLLPTRIRSEKDTEHWVANVFLRPALAVCHAVYSTDTDPFARIGRRPNITSCSGGGKGKSVPDMALWGTLEGQEDDSDMEDDSDLENDWSLAGDLHLEDLPVVDDLGLEGDLDLEDLPVVDDSDLHGFHSEKSHSKKSKPNATIEIKTQAAFIDTTHPNKAPTFEHLTGKFKVEPGSAIRFVWPYSDDSVGSLSSKADKIITQVWIQMCQYGVDLAALTNYTVIIFFFRKGDTLFLSREYGGDDILLATFAFHAFALGFLNESQLDLPEPNECWKDRARFPDNGTSEKPGTDPTYVLIILSEI